MTEDKQTTDLDAILSSGAPEKEPVQQQQPEPKSVEGEAEAETGDKQDAAPPATSSIKD